MRYQINYSLPRNAECGLDYFWQVVTDKQSYEKYQNWKMSLYYKYFNKANPLMILEDYNVLHFIDFYKENHIFWSIIIITRFQTVIGSRCCHIIQPFTFLFFTSSVEKEKKVHCFTICQISFHFFFNLKGHNTFNFRKPECFVFASFEYKGHQSSTLPFSFPLNLTAVLVWTFYGPIVMLHWKRSVQFSLVWKDSWFTQSDRWLCTGEAYYMLSKTLP